MVLTLDVLKEYAAMDTLQRHSERGKAIRAELEERMRWMPIRWRRLIRYRYILRYSALRTATELNVHKNTVTNWTHEIERWLEDKETYLNEQT